MVERSGKVIAATFAAAVMLGAAGCHSSSSPAAGDAGVTGTAPSTSATAQPSSAATSAAPTTAGSTPASAAATGKQTTATQSGSGSGTAAKPPGKPSGFTRAGTYTYDISGTAQSPFGGQQNLSGTDTDTVDAPQGSDQHSKTNGQNGSQEQTLQVRSSGLYVVDIKIASQGFNEEFKPVGTAMYFPASYSVGKHWSWQAKSTDGKYTLDVNSKISGQTTQNVGGKSLKALVVDSTLHITGTGFDLTSQQRDWVSVQYALVLKEHTVTHGTAYGANISSDATRKLRSTNPS